MITDYAAICIAVCLFSLVSFVPGYALGWLLDTMRFRERALYWRLALSVPLSMAVAPVLIYLLGRWLSTTAACMVLAALCMYALLLFVRDLNRSSPLFPSFSRAHFQVLAAVIAWIAIAGLSLADLQIGRRLYFSVIGVDYAVRTAFTSAISTFGLPPRNPFFFPGHAVGLRYHYYWLIPPALLERMSGPLIDSRQVLIGATIWCGIGLICTIALYLRFFSPNAGADICRRTLVGILLLGVTGLDILPTLFLVWMAHKGAPIPIAPSVEWWNNQIDGWIFTMLWQPHSLSSLIACLTGFLIVWDAAREPSRRRRILSAITAGFAFATAVGSSIYVTLVFAIFLVLWTALTIAKTWYRETLLLIVSGGIAFVLSVPFLISLGGPGSGGALIKMTVRSFLLGEILLKTLRFDRPWQILIGDGIFLPLNYFLELGFFFVVGRIVWQRFRREKRALSRTELASFTMIASSVAACTFLKSGVIANNDLGWRGFLIAQFMLLIFGADLLSVKPKPQLIAAPDCDNQSLRPRDKRLLTAFLILGAAGVIYDLAMLRFFPVLSDAGVVPKIAWLARDQKLGSRTYANREAYEWLRAGTPVDAIVQQNPSVNRQQTFYGLYANRQTVAEDSLCGTIFGGDPVQCAPFASRVTALFSGKGSSSQSFDSACEDLPVDVFAAKDTDPVWNDHGSWVWTRKPAFANDFVRFFACHPIPAQGSGERIRTLAAHR